MDAEHRDQTSTRLKYYHHIIYPRLRTYAEFIAIVDGRLEDVRVSEEKSMVLQGCIAVGQLPRRSSKTTNSIKPITEDILTS